MGNHASFGSGSTAFTSTGLQNGETIGSVTIAASGGTAANAAVGNYTLTANTATGGTFDADDYKIVYSPGNLVVNAASLTITANDESKTYGQALSFGSGSTAFTSTGLQNGETIGSVTIAASGGTAANAAVGNYTLTANTATGGTFDADDYKIVYSPGNLVVNAASLTITANDESKTYGQVLTFGSGSTAFTSTGLQNGETTLGDHRRQRWHGGQCRRG